MTLTVPAAGTLKLISWAAVSMPFVFIAPALMARFSYPGPAYQILFNAAMKIELFAPLLGLVLGFIAWKTRLGKAGVVVNALALGLNSLWVFVLIPQALRNTKLF